VGVAREQGLVALPPAEAMHLWLDPRRWPTFVDGFGRLVEHPGDWPATERAKLVWESHPGGRGRVTEKVVEYEPPYRFVGDVFEQKMMGRQTVVFSPAEEGTTVAIELDYRLTEGGPMRWIADVFFIRPRLRESMRRTLRRFATEAAEEATLNQL
jgi:hypothetical protein